MRKIAEQDVGWKLAVSPTDENEVAGEVISYLDYKYIVPYYMYGTLEYLYTVLGKSSAWVVLQCIETKYRYIMTFPKFERDLLPTMNNRICEPYYYMFVKRGMAQRIERISEDVL